LRKAGFRSVKTTDTTENAVSISQRWREAREERRAALTAIEGKANFEGLQQFLSCVHLLTSERRLLRFLYFAQKSA
jgi:hypothetical protein